MTSDISGPRRRAALIVATVAAAVLLIGFLTYPRASGRHLNPAEFSALAAEETTVLLDVRSREEFERGHLMGARNLDVTSDEFTQTLSRMDPTVTYAVYCCTGARSSQALGAMESAGFTDVSDLDGGITRWIREGGEVVRE